MANDSLEKELVLFRLFIQRDEDLFTRFMVTEKDYSEKEAFKALLQEILNNDDWCFWFVDLDDRVKDFDPVLHDTIEKKIEEMKKYEEYFDWGDFDWKKELLEQCLKYPIEQVLKFIRNVLAETAEFKAEPYKLGTSFVIYEEEKIWQTTL